MEITECTFDTGAVTINYAESGTSGPPLVWLHGGAASWQYYQDVLSDLAARFHLYAPISAGTGDRGVYRAGIASRTMQGMSLRLSSAVSQNRFCSLAILWVA